jgi:FkbM family methyltransferase
VLHGAEIVAIEANPNLRPAIEEAWRSAGADFDHGNQLEIVNCAILDQEGSIDFFLTPNLDDSSMFSGRVAGASKITVVGRPLDSFYKPSKRTFIKMDIEGAEYRVLNSAPRFLGCGHAEFLLELHPFGEAGIKKYPLQVYHLFFRNGYGCRRVFHHYHFSRMDLVQRTALYCIHFPHLVLMWLPNRFPGRLGRAIARVHGLLAKIRRRLFP